MYNCEIEELTDGLYYCCDGVSDIIPNDYACPERIDAYLEDEVFEQVCIDSFDKLDLNSEDDYALLQNRMAKVGTWLKTQIKMRSNPSIPMAKIRLDKHEVYKYIADHPEQFQSKHTADGKRYVSRGGIEALINRELRKETVCNYCELYAATLTAMVNDGVLERKHIMSSKYYQYCPILPIDEEYKAA